MQGSMGKRARRFSNLPALCLIAAFSTGCASDETTFIRSNGTWPEPRQLAAASATCTRPGASVLGVVGGAVKGAAVGPYLGLVYGAQSGPIGAVAGAGIGLLAGPVIGAMDAIPPDDYDFCMARSGYQRVDPEQAAALAPREPTR
jgi:hypothetical protein